MSHVYTINALKSFVGREGYGFNCNLLRNGKKVAFVQDMADGGEIRFDWICPKNCLPVECEHNDGTKYTENRNVEEILLRNHISTIEEYKEGSRGDMDCFVAGLVDEYENEKKNKAKCKKNIMFRSSDGHTYSVKGQYNEQNKKTLMARYPDIVEFINERFAKV